MQLLLHCWDQFSFYNHKPSVWTSKSLFSKQSNSSPINLMIIFQIIIYNRADCPTVCPQRLNGFQVTVGNNPPTGSDNTICGGMDVVPQDNPVINVTCPSPLIGQYVKLQIPPGNYLHACEVQVMGVEPIGRCYCDSFYYIQTHTNNYLVLMSLIKY